MVTARKLYERLAAGGYDIRFRDFCRMVEAFGFELHRIRGSHRIYKHDKVPRVLNVQPDGDRAKRYQIREFLDMIVDYELRITE